MTYNRDTHAAMMATPLDLEDFAIGSSLAERIVDGADGIAACEIVTVAPDALECRMTLGTDAADRLRRRRRFLAGVTGCGLRGVESLEEALRPPEPVGLGPRVTADEIGRAVASLRPAQALNARTRAVHAAAFWRPGCGLVAVREDVGRHNALDKLAGALARARLADALPRGEGPDPLPHNETPAASTRGDMTDARPRGGTEDGRVLLTSRLSVELVRKAAIMRVAVLIAVSAPTTLALRAAEITVVGVARDDGFEVFTRPDRVI